MRILQLISSGGYYGAEAVAASLSLELRKLGHEVVLGVFHNTHNPHLEIAERARQHGVQLEIIACQGKLDWAAVRAVQRCMREHRIDLVHTHGYKSNFYAYLATRLSRKALVATCHTWSTDALSLRIYGALDRRLVRGFDRIVSVSDRISSILEQGGVAREKLQVIYNGIEVEPFRSATPSLCQEWHVNGDLLIGLIGRLTEQKGPAFLLRAAREVVQQHPSARFVLVGSGPLRERLEALARELNIQNNTCFAGTRNDMPGVYASLDIFVLPSLYEGLPMALLEALAAGKPVIATPVGAVPKLIQNQETGLLVEPENSQSLYTAICRLITDASLRHRLAANGQRFVQEHFSAESMAQKYVGVYEDALRGSGVPSKRAEPVTV